MPNVCERTRLTMPAGRFQDNPAYHAEIARIRASAALATKKAEQADAAAQTLRDRLIAEKRCIKCGLHCPERYDHMKSHMCGDCFWIWNS